MIGTKDFYFVPERRMLKMSRCWSGPVACFMHKFAGKLKCPLTPLTYTFKHPEYIEKYDSSHRVIWNHRMHQYTSTTSKFHVCRNKDKWWTSPDPNPRMWILQAWTHIGDHSMVATTWGLIRRPLGIRSIWNRLCKAQSHSRVSMCMWWSRDSTFRRMERRCPESTRHYCVFVISRTSVCAANKGMRVDTCDMLCVESQLESSEFDRIVYCF